MQVVKREQASYSSFISADVMRFVFWICTRSNVLLSWLDWSTAEVPPSIDVITARKIPMNSSLSFKTRAVFKNVPTNVGLQSIQCHPDPNHANWPMFLGNTQ